MQVVKYIVVLFHNRCILKLFIASKINCLFVIHLYVFLYQELDLICVHVQ